MESERIYTVYMHTCLKNNKKYIGITMCKPEQRWQNGKAYGTCRLFNSAIKKYGWDNFEHKILFSQLTKKEASNMEISLIKKYQSNNINFGYNLDSGGLGSKTTYKNTAKSKRRVLGIANISTGEVFDTQREAARKYNTSQPEIFRACTKQQQTCQGYIWGFIFNDDYVFKDPREHALSFGCYGELYENPKYHERIIRYYIEDYLGLNIYDDL